MKRWKVVLSARAYASREFAVEAETMEQAHCIAQMNRDNAEFDPDEFRCEEVDISELEEIKPDPIRLITLTATTRVRTSFLAERKEAILRILDESNYCFDSIRMEDEDA